MTVDRECFLISQRQAYNWPSNQTLTKKPCIKEQPKNLYVAKLQKSMNSEDSNQHDGHMKHCQKLSGNEQQNQNSSKNRTNKTICCCHPSLYKKSQEANIHQAINQEVLSSKSKKIQEQPCDKPKVKVESIYQTDYTKKDLVRPTKFKEIKQAYKDPTEFRCKAIICKGSLDLCARLTANVGPKIRERWGASTTGTTEYQDTISKTGNAVTINQQQYREPMTSTRRKFGDVKIY